MQNTNKQLLLELIESEDASALFDHLDEWRGAYAVAFILNALSEDEITENGALVLSLLKKIIDPRNNNFNWTDKW